MQQKNPKNKKILQAISIVIKKLRQEKQLSLNLFAMENDLQKSLISRLENAKNEPTFISIWKVAEAFGVKPSDLVKKIEKELPENFSFIEN